MLDCIFVNPGVPALEGKFSMSEQGLGDSSRSRGRARAVSSISASSSARFGYFRRLHVALRTIEFVTLAAIALLLLSGCTAQAIDRMDEQLAARRTESLAGWEDVSLDGRPILETLWFRVAMVWRDFDSVSAEIDDSGLRFTGNGEDNSGTSTAAAITRDGYLLTAGYVVRDAEKLDVVVLYPGPDRRGQVKVVQARVVWKSDEDFDRDWDSDPPKLPLDFAILHVDMDGLAPFELADGPPGVDEGVISAGLGSAARSEPVENVELMAAGRVLSVHEQPPRGSSPAWKAVLHDTSIIGGDSGGSLLDRTGKLVGINGLTHFKPTIWRALAMRLGRSPGNPEDIDYKALACLPDPDWIRQVIEDDRAQRGAGTESSAPE